MGSNRWLEVLLLLALASHGARGLTKPPAVLCVLFACRPLLSGCLAWVRCNGLWVPLKVAAVVVHCTIRLTITASESGGTPPACRHLAKAGARFCVLVCRRRRRVRVATSATSRHYSSTCTRQNYPKGSQGDMYAGARTRALAKLSGLASTCSVPWYVHMTCTRTSTYHTGRGRLPSCMRGDLDSLVTTGQYGENESYNGSAPAARAAQSAIPAAASSTSRVPRCPSRHLRQSPTSVRQPRLASTCD